MASARFFFFMPEVKRGWGEDFGVGFQVRVMIAWRLPFWMAYSKYSPIWNRYFNSGISVVHPDPIVRDLGTHLNHQAIHPGAFCPSHIKPQWMHQGLWFGVAILCGLFTWVVGSSRNPSLIIFIYIGIRTSLDRMFWDTRIYFHLYIKRRQKQSNRLQCSFRI